MHAYHACMHAYMHAYIMHTGMQHAFHRMHPNELGTSPTIVHNLVVYECF